MGEPVHAPAPSRPPPAPVASTLLPKDFAVAKRRLPVETLAGKC